MSTERVVSMFQILNHGPENESYFQGCGVALTEYTDVATGIGDDAKEAYEDAVEQLATNGWDVARLPKRPRGIRQADRLTREQGEHGEWHWYVSVRVRDNVS
jgi:hypothetical protein